MSQSEEEISRSLLRRLIEEPGVCPSAAEVERLAEAYPYMALPAALRLKRAEAGSMSDEERATLTARVAAGAPSRDTLFRLLDPDGNLLAGFMPPEKPATPTATTTDSAIDTFLATYGRMSEREEALLEKMIFNPVPDDYNAILAGEAVDEPDQAEAVEEPAGSTKGSEQDRLLDAFLAGGEEPAPAKRPAATTPVAPPPSSSLSESLAQVYIRRGRYDKAYDIIHALSLNNPKKSVYFADQLRFLQKLMLNERYSRPSGSAK